jgi:MoaA/NifB/PqqE/SkfB family radical SAM enzyme
VTIPSNAALKARSFRASLSKEYIMKLYISMVIPAPGGCDLACPFCAIKQRGEAETTNLEPKDYVHFLSSLSGSFSVERFSLQGYEPLLPECWEQTLELLTLADTLEVPGTSIVTNGTHLGEYSQWLSEVCDEVIVSLDSGDHAIHDKLRGVVGAFDRTYSSMRTAIRHFGDALIVNSVLIPSKREYLESVPAVISAIGVSEWYITPLADFRTARYREQDISRLRDDVLFLTRKAEESSVHCHLSDDVGWFNLPQIRETVSIARPENGVRVLRLSPDGTCAVDDEVLRESRFAQHWDTKEEPSEFVARILGS